MNTKKIVFNGLIISIGIVLPFLFHISGINGKVLSPIHYAGYFGGLLLGPLAGLVVGFTTPILNSFLTGMPPFPLFWFIALEVAVYGVVVGLLNYKLKVNIFISMAVAMIVGKTTYYLAAYFIGMKLLKSPMMTVTFGWDLLTSGIIAQVVQFLVIPIVVMRLRSVTNLNVNEKK